MTALDQRRRSRTWMMLAVTMVTLVIVPLLGYVGVRAVLNSSGGKDARADNLPVQTFPPTPTGLYLTTDAQGGLSSATVFVLDPSLVGGSVITLPVNADVGFADDARQSLQQVFANGGVEETTMAVESLVLVGLTYTEVTDAAHVAGLLSPLAPLTIELAAEVDTAASGDTNQSAPVPAGTAVLDAVTASKVLAESPVTSAGGQSGHRANAEALWSSVALSVGAGRPTTVDLAVSPTSMNELVAHLLAGPVRTRGLATRALTETENPSAVDAVQVDHSDAVLVFASIAPGSMSAPSPGLLIRLEAPPGFEEQVKRTIDKLLYVGGNIVSVDMSAASRPDTVLLVPDEVNRTQAEQTNGIFGSIAFVDPTVRIDGVDATIVLGTDYLMSSAS